MDGQAAGWELQQSISTATTYWRLQHPDSFCQTPRTAIPWLLSIIVLTVCWTIFLGANDVHEPFTNSLSPLSRGTRWGLRVFGSLILQLSFLVATAQLLRKGSTTTTGEGTKLASAIGAWAVRPMPGLVVSMTSVMNVSTYTKNAMEIQYVETLLGLATGYFYINIIPDSQKSISAFARLSGGAFPLAPSASAVVTSTTGSSISIFTQATTVPNAKTFPTSLDGSCRASVGYTCLGSEFGECCNAYNICGNQSAYCEARGCQPEYGSCSSTAKTIRRRRERNTLREKKTIEIREVTTGPGGHADPEPCVGERSGGIAAVAPHTAVATTPTAEQAASRNMESVGMPKHQRI